VYDVDSASFRLDARNASVEGQNGDTNTRAMYFAAFVKELAASDIPLESAAAHIARTQNQQRCDLEVTKQGASWARGDGRRHDIGICLQIRNDAGILDEYIAFHWLHVRVYDWSVGLVVSMS
jgi:hypothetical protein